MMRKVSLYFSDGSLGGTSRSALETGKAWVSAGYVVDFHPLIPIHAERRHAFAEVGNVVNDSATPFHHPDIIHFHHGAWSAPQREAARSILEHARTLKSWPHLVTHNVFGVPDRILDGWKGRRTVGVLGEWSAAQYLSSMGRDRPRVVIVPNPQNTSFFRPPSAEEADAARTRLSLDRSARVLSRVGSPHPEKWSRSYVKVIQTMPQAQFVLLGAPSELKEALAARPNVAILPQTSDDRVVRDLYWASDCFLHIADRGESFGNVLLEAAGCGARVVTQPRRLRDNTPWEFSRLGIVESAPSTSALVELARLGRATSARAHEIHRSVEAHYGTEAVGRQLAKIAIDGEPRIPMSIGGLNRLLVYVGHNPLISAAKSRRLR